MECDCTYLRLTEFCELCEHNGLIFVNHATSCQSSKNSILAVPQPIKLRSRDLLVEVDWGGGGGRLLFADYGHMTSMLRPEM